MSVATENFDWVADLVREKSAIVLARGKEYLVESRLSGLARRLGHGCVDELVTSLRTDSDHGLHEDVVEALTTNETSWYRDPAVYDCLREHVFPDLIQRRQAERALHIWSAACSTGQEPYTVAMLLLDQFPELSRWNLEILATDINDQVLEKAEEGRYTQLEVNRGLPARNLVKHFTKQGTDWQANQGMRDLVRLRKLCLHQPWGGLPSMDLILLRNVLIYFDEETRRDILGRAARLLRPDGYLVLGTAETPTGASDAFEARKFGRVRVYQRRGNDEVAPDKLRELATDIWSTHLLATTTRIDSAVTSPWVYARIPYKGAWRGELILTCQTSLAAQVAGHLFGTGSVSASQLREAMAEVLNMLAVPLKSALPTPTILGAPKVQLDDHPRPCDTNSRYRGAIKGMTYELGLVSET